MIFILTTKYSNDYLYKNYPALPKLASLVRQSELSPMRHGGGFGRQDRAQPDSVMTMPGKQRPADLSNACNKPKSFTLPPCFYNFLIVNFRSYYLLRTDFPPARPGVPRSFSDPPVSTDRVGDSRRQPWGDPRRRKIGSLFRTSDSRFIFVAHPQWRMCRSNVVN